MPLTARSLVRNATQNDVPPQGPHVFSFMWFARKHAKHGGQKNAQQPVRQTTMREHHHQHHRDCHHRYTSQAAQ